MQTNNVATTKNVAITTTFTSPLKVLLTLSKH